MSATSRTNALTAIAPLAPRRLWWCRLVLPVLRILAMSSPLVRLRSIHFGGWVVFDEAPGRTPPRWRSRPTMLFLSNYDGGFAEYLAAFGIAASAGMRWSFGSAEGFPGVRPTRRFSEYVEQRRVDELLRYAAYPDSTVRDIDTALAVSERFDELRRIPDDADEAFAASYRRLLEALALAPSPVVPSLWSGLWRAWRRSSSVRGVVVVMPVAAGRGGALRTAIAALAEQRPPVFDEVSGVHFARFAVVGVPGRSNDQASVAADPEFLLLAAWVDGAADDFLRRLAVRSGDWADAVWGCCAGYPAAADADALAAWIGEHRLAISLFVGTHVGVGADAIRTALDLRQRLADVVTDLQGRSPPEIRRGLTSP